MAAITRGFSTGTDGLSGIMTAAVLAPNLLASMMRPASHEELFRQLDKIRGQQNRAEFEQITCSVKGLVASQLAGMDGPQLANVCWSLACLGINDNPLMLSLFEVRGAPYFLIKMSLT